MRSGMPRDGVVPSGPVHVRVCELFGASPCHNSSMQRSCDSGQQRAPMQVEPQCCALVGRIAGVYVQTQELHSTIFDCTITDACFLLIISCGEGDGSSSAGVGFLVVPKMRRCVVGFKQEWLSILTRSTLPLHSNRFLELLDLVALQGFRLLWDWDL